MCFETACICGCIITECHQPPIFGYPRGRSRPQGPIVSVTAPGGWRAPRRRDARVHTRYRLTCRDMAVGETPFCRPPVSPVLRSDHPTRPACSPIAALVVAEAATWWSNGQPALAPTFVDDTPPRGCAMTPTSQKRGASCTPVRLDHISPLFAYLALATSPNVAVKG